MSMLIEPPEMSDIDLSDRVAMARAGQDCYRFATETALFIVNILLSEEADQKELAANGAALCEKAQRVLLAGMILEKLSKEPS